MYICLLHAHLYTYDMRVLYIFSNHMFTWWFSHHWHLGLLICRSRYETPNGEEEAPYYLESKIRQNDGLSRAELTDSEPRLELAIQNPTLQWLFEDDVLLPMELDTPWKINGNLVHLQIHPSERFLKMIIQPNLHEDMFPH